MSYIQNSVWSNSTTNFPDADTARANMRSYLPESHNSYVKPEAENVSFDVATQTLSFTRNWDSESDYIAFFNFCSDNSLNMGEWQEIT
jgi:hypothetical protein